MNRKIPLKIYGVASVGAKGQIILPIEAREDFDIKIGKIFGINSMNCIESRKNQENIAFAIYEDFKNIEYLKKIKEKKGIIFMNKSEIKIGTKFQFVIPVQIRNDLNIEPGNSLIVIGKKGQGIGFIRNDKINLLFEFIKEELNY
ncbi:hypothetical protein DLH72_00665 [Candidatus Gracilibacteria bacterium]|nr:MAG: hypothetical protein DLH72_00665 [Candidatus Gracilibacteria bacterium]